MEMTFVIVTHSEKKKKHVYRISDLHRNLLFKWLTIKTSISIVSINIAQ